MYTIIDYSFENIECMYDWLKLMYHSILAAQKCSCEYLEALFYNPYILLEILSHRGHFFYILTYLYCVYTIYSIQGVQLSIYVNPDFQGLWTILYWA